MTDLKKCQNCQVDFQIYPEDRVFYERLDVPEPTFCPECRMIRRLAYRNERALYKYTCKLCKKLQIGMYPEDSEYTAYCEKCWWTDGWDPLEYGVDYDFTKPFFQQFAEQLKRVPRPAVARQGENPGSDYTNRVTDQRNCYLVFGGTNNEYCHYGSWVNDCKECTDIYAVEKSEKCYESIDCLKSYNLAFSQECNSCSDSAFLLNCVNCTDCFGCINLRNKSYCIFNKQYSKEEYEKIVKEYDLKSFSSFEDIRNKFNELKKASIVPSLITHKSENVVGNWIESSKDVYRTFTCRNVEECRYSQSIFDSKQIMDHTHWGNGSERTYECSSVGLQSANVRFCAESWSQLLDSQYSNNCHTSQDLFGCIGVRNGQYVILNKQYTKEEYEAFVPKILAHMNEMPYIDRKGRIYKYGEFFPMEIHPYKYNETLAHEFFPISKEEAEKRGYPWKEGAKREHSITIKAEDLPDSIDEVEDSILKEVIGCAHEGNCIQLCTKAFKLIPEELAFYRSRGLALPRLCSNCRHFERLAKRNPMNLWSRNCQCAGTYSDNGLYKNVDENHPAHKADEHCPEDFQTSYSPEKPASVYDLGCYRKEVV